MREKLHIEELAQYMRVQQDVVEALVCAEVKTLAVVRGSRSRGVEDVSIPRINLGCDEVRLIKSQDRLDLVIVNGEGRYLHKQGWRILRL